MELRGDSEYTDSDRSECDVRIGGQWLYRTLQGWRVLAHRERAARRRERRVPVRESAPEMERVVWLRTALRRRYRRGLAAVTFDEGLEQREPDVTDTVVQERDEHP